MVFPNSVPGNKVAEKLKTPELRQLAFKSYCDWLALGKSKRCWNLENPVRLSWETMEKYLRGEYAHEFDFEEMRIAISKGRNKWETLLEEAAEGKNKKINPFCLRMVLHNKYRIGLVDEAKDDDASLSAKHATDVLLKQLDEMEFSLKQELHREKEEFLSNE